MGPFPGWTCADCRWLETWARTSEGKSHWCLARRAPLAGDRSRVRACADFLWARRWDRPGRRRRSPGAPR